MKLVKNSRRVRQGWPHGYTNVEVLMGVFSSRRLALVQHRHLPAHGLLSFLSLLSAFLLNVIKRNQAQSAVFVAVVVWMKLIVGLMAGAIRSFISGP